MEWLKTKLGIEPSEINPFLLMLLLSFLIGGGNVFVDAAANALFVAEFGAGQLPFAYVISAVVMIVVGFAYSRLEPHFPLKRMLSITMLTIVVVTAAIKIGYDQSQNRIFVFAAQIWFRFIFVYSDLVFWAAAGLLFTIQQGKRLFGLISTGNVLARIVGFLLVPLIVPLIGSSNLLLLSSIFLAGAWVLVVKILGSHDRSYIEDGQAGSAETSQDRPQRYINLIYTVFGVGSVTFYVIGFNFYTQSGIQFSNDADSLAGFFGLFSGITNICVLLVNSLATGSMLRRFGLTRSMLVRPTLSFALVVIILILLLTNSGPLVLLFTLTLAVRFFDLLLYYGLYRPGLVLLYQPLSKKMRTSVQSLTEGVVGSLALGVSGMMLILIGSDNIVLNTVFLLILLVIWMTVLWRISREYPLVLQRALYQRLLTDSALDLSEAETLKTIRQRLDGENASDVVYALELLERVGPPDLFYAITQSLAHGDPVVREDAARRVARLNMPGVQGQLIEIAEGDASLASRQAAVNALCVTSSAETVPFLLRYLDAPEQSVRQAAMIGLLNSKTEIGRGTAQTQLTKLLAGSSAEKITACQILRESAQIMHQDSLVDLLEDEDVTVQRAAIEAAGKLETTYFNEILLKKLDNPALAKEAVQALSNSGAAILPALKRAFAVGDDSARKVNLIQVASRIGDDASLKWLSRLLGHEERQIQMAVLRGLQRGRFAASDEQKVLVNAQISAEIQLATNVVAALHILEPDDSLALLHSALSAQVAEIRQRVYMLLSFTHDRQMMQRVQENLRLHAVARHSYAIELLDTALDQRIKQQVLPLLEPHETALRLDRLTHFTQPLPHDKQGWLTEMIEAQAVAFTPWVRASTIYTMGQQQIADFARPIALAADSAEQIVRNTADWTLSTNYSEDVGEHSTMMPTIEKVIILRSVSLFSTIPEGTLVRIAELLNEETWEAGHQLFQKGDYGDDMYIIVSGRVRVHIGDETLNFLEDRDVFGEMALLDPEPRVASVTTFDRTVLLRLNQAPLFELMEDQPAVARGIISVLSSHLRDRVQDLREARKQIGALQQS